jgi:hypothetical protein
VKSAIIAGGFLSLSLAFIPPQQEEECAIYAEAIRLLAPDTTKGIVLYDSTSMAVPQFAFHAWTGMGYDPKDTGVVINRDMQSAMNEGMKNRKALPACQFTPKGATRVWYDSARALFKDRNTGWDAFRAAYPNTNGFFMLSHVHWLNPDHTLAIVYAARAQDWLGGQGRMIVLSKASGRWVISKSRGVWVS